MWMYHKKLMRGIEVESRPLWRPREKQISRTRTNDTAASLYLVAEEELEGREKKIRRRRSTGAQGEREWSGVKQRTDTSWLCHVLKIYIFPFTRSENAAATMMLCPVFKSRLEPQKEGGGEQTKKKNVGIFFKVEIL